MNKLRLFALFLVVAGFLTVPVPAPTARADGPTVDEIVASAIDATSKVETVKMNMDMAMAVASSAGPLPGTMTAKITATGAVDNVKKQMSLAMTASMDGLSGHGTLTSQMESYMLDGWMYFKVDLPGIGAQWMKVKVNDELWRQQESQISIYREWLQSANEIILQGTEDIDGVPAYVVKITPSPDALFKWLSQQQASATKGVDGSSPDIAQMFKRMTVTEWIASDSFLVNRMDMDILASLPGPDGTAAATSMDIKLSAKLFDYNQPVSVVLPPEAAGAQEMPTP